MLAIPEKNSDQSKPVEKVFSRLIPPVTPEYALMMSFPDWGGGSTNSAQHNTRGDDNPLTEGLHKISLVLKITQRQLGGY